jgi:hypothetical protein
VRTGFESRLADNPCGVHREWACCPMTPHTPKRRKSKGVKPVRLWFAIDSDGDIWAESGSVSRTKSMWYATEINTGEPPFSRGWQARWKQLVKDGYSVKQFDLVPVVASKKGRKA